MWVLLNDCFFSVVHKDCQRDEVLIRARRSGDIEKIFPRANPVTSDETDYRFRAVVKKEELATALVGEVHRITYDNFKDSVDDLRLHDAYGRVWFELAKLQPVPPYGGRFQRAMHPADTETSMLYGRTQQMGIVGPAHDLDPINLIRPGKPLKAKRRKRR